MKLAKYFTIYYLSLQQGIIYLCSNYLVAALIPVLFCSYDRRRPKTFLKLGGYMLLSCVASELLSTLFYSMGLDSVQHAYLATLCVTCAFAAFSCRFDWRVRLAMLFAYSGTYPLVEGICMGFADLAQEEKSKLTGVLLVATFLVMVSLSAIYRYIAHWGLESLQTLLPLGCVGMLSYAAGFSIKAFSFAKIFIIVSYLLFLAILLNTYYFVFFIDGNLRERSRSQAEHFLQQANENMLSVLDASMERYTRIRHDMQNQYAIMKTLLEAQEYDKLQAYFSEYSEQFFSLFSVVDCGNRIVTIILNMETEKAKRAGLHLRTAVAVPSELGISDLDLCTLLTNLLDNAIEYLASCPDIQPREVQLELRLLHRSLLLVVRNPLAPEDEEQSLSLLTRKQEKELHGFGTKIAAKIVRAYGGIIRYRAEAGCFVADAVLTIPETERKEQPCES